MCFAISSSISRGHSFAVFLPNTILSQSKAKFLHFPQFSFLNGMTRFVNSTDREILIHFIILMTQKFCFTFFDT